MRRAAASLAIAGLLLGTALPAAAETAPAPASITPDDLRPHIAYLASDELEGRAPDSEGGRKAVYYIASQWSAAGLQPGAAGDSWYAPVDMVTVKPLTGSMQFHTSDGKTVPTPERMLLLSGRDRSAALQRVPLVFTGYGIAADAAAPDLSGKLALMLADHAPGEHRDLAARAAALAAAGASGVVLIFDPGDPVSRLRAGWYRQTSMLLADQARQPAFYGGMSDDAARRLFAATGDTLAEARLRAEADPGLAEPMALTADLSASSEVARLSSYNVIGRVPGTDPKSGAVLMLAHWDHLGICRGPDAADRICNGAVDNASGVAVLIEVARRLAQAPRLDRDIYVLATTGEEIGLLGAKAFVEEPPVPLDRVVAALNLDTLAIGPAGSPLAIIGRGETPIARDVAKVAQALGRRIDADDDANAYIKRQDGWALLEQGVPTVMANGAFSDSAQLNAFISGAYHGPDDALTDATELRGAAEDADLHVALGRYFGDKQRYPARGRGDPPKR